MSFLLIIAASAKPTAPLSPQEQYASMARRGPISPCDGIAILEGYLEAAPDGEVRATIQLRLAELHNEQYRRGLPPGVRGVRRDLRCVLPHPRL